MTLSTERRTIGVVLLLTMVALVFVFVQQAQIREMRMVDCAAYSERVDRVKLYDSLVAYWEPRDAGLAEAYAQQRESVKMAADAGVKECQ